MPIHLRAEPGDYAEACLLPGDPLRAQYIAETFFEDAREVNRERGMLGFTGIFRGRPVSVQASGMGCPSAAIVIEELGMLGVKRILRVGTCGGLQPDMALGDLIVAISAIPADSTATHLVPEPHTPTADWQLVHGAVHAAKELGKPVRVGPIVSSDLFYNPDDGQYARWSARGILAVEMEAAVLFTLGALKGIQAGCLLTVSDVVVEGEFVRISDEEMRAGRRPDDRARADDGHGGPLAPAPSFSSIRRRPAARRESAGQRSHGAQLSSASRATRSSPRRDSISASSRTMPSRAARRCSSPSAATAR